MGVKVVIGTVAIMGVGVGIRMAGGEEVDLLITIYCEAVCGSQSQLSSYHE